MKAIRFIAIAVFGTAFCLASCNLLLSARGETHVRLNKDKTGPAAKEVETPADMVIVSEEVEAKEEEKKKESTAGFVPKPGKLSADEVIQLLKEVDLHQLISSNTDTWQKVYNGFTGKDNYRVEFYIDNVRLDADDAGAIIIDGKTRYKKTVRPFTGTMKVESIVAYKELHYKYEQALKAGKTYDKADSVSYNYTASGTFRIAEKQTAKGAGVYSGKLNMDIGPNKNKDKEGTYKLAYVEDSPTRYAGLLMEGQWEGYDGGKRQLLAARNFFEVSNEVLKDFYYGGRERDINDKYRSLGWQDYWENPEWWAEDAKDAVTVK